MQDQRVVFPESIFNRFDVLFSAQHLVLVQLGKRKAHLPCRRRDLPVQLHDLVQHLPYRAALFRFFFRRTGKDAVKALPDRRVDPGIVDAAGVKGRIFQFIRNIRIPAIPQSFQNVLVEQAVHQFAHGIHVRLWGQSLLTAAVSQLRRTESRGRHDRILAERSRHAVFQLTRTAEVDQHRVLDFFALVVQHHEHIAQIDIPVQVSCRVDLCQQHQQMPDDHQGHFQRRHRQHRFALRLLQVAQRGVFALSLRGFAQNVLDPPAIPVVEVIHFQNTAGQSTLHLPHRAVRLTDLFHLQHSTHRPHMSRFLRDLLADVHLTLCQLHKARIAAQQTVIVVRAVQIFPPDRHALPAFPTLGIELFQHPADAAPCLFRIVDDGRSTGFVGCCDLVPRSLLRIQNRSVLPFRSHHAIPPYPLFFSVYHSQSPENIDIFHNLLFYFCAGSPAESFLRAALRFLYTGITGTGNHPVG